MDGATLRLLERLRGASDPAGVPPRTSLEAFMCLLSGTADGLDSTERLCVDVAATTEGPRAEAFAMLYRASGELNLHPRQAPGMLALEGLLQLPKAERAAIALSCVAGFADAEVGAVIGVVPAEARATIETGIRTIRTLAQGEGRRGRDGRAA